MGKRRPANTAEANTDSDVTNNDVGNDDISKIYAQIKDNKRTVHREVEMMQDTAEDPRPDPGFRIYRVDHETREQREVPPYTSPQEMEDMIAAEKRENENRVDNNNGNSEENTSKIYAQIKDNKRSTESEAISTASSI